MPNRPKLKKVSGNLNIVLSKDQINEIVRQVVGQKGEKIAPAALASNHCCVDVAVGSSVVGPVSTVASSVSVPDPQGAIQSHDIAENIDLQGIKSQFTVPKNITLK
jgi:hypothetical protein